MHRPLRLIALLAAAGAAIAADDAARPHEDPVVEATTPRSIGLHWLVDGDDDANAVVHLAIRREGESAWREAAPLLRNARRDGPYRDQGREPRQSLLVIPPGGELFAGSAVQLEPGTAYELRLTLADPDGGAAERILRATTRTEPVDDPAAPERHVVPGDGGGSGTAQDPFKGIAAAEKAAKPGDRFLLHAGVYVRDTWDVAAFGEPGKPITWRGAGDGDAVIDGGRPTDALEGAAIRLPPEAHDVWFERLTIRGAWNGIRAHGADRLVVRRCRFTDFVCGVVGVSADPNRLQHDWFITDNLMEGVQKWPVTDDEYARGAESRAVWLTGRGHVVAYNRIHHVKDGIDVGDGACCDNIDIYRNEVSECFDDGCELDGTERNNRLFENRFTDVLVGVSFQPIYGGPAYAFRNVVYNIRGEPLKFHNAPSGAIAYHNTFVRRGGPAYLATEDSPVNCRTRDNLFVGTEGRAYHVDPPMIACDFDYDGFAGSSGDVFIKWCGVKYASLDEVHAKAPVERHAIAPTRLFASGIAAPDRDDAPVDAAAVDLRLRADSEAVDAGEPLPGFDDGFAGKAPDLGAYELGAPLPSYGVRPEAKR